MDAVVIFDEDTPHEVIAALQPDVLVKGADWAEDAIVGRDIVEARGGRVVRIPVEAGYSTTRDRREDSSSLAGRTCEAEPRSRLSNGEPPSRESRRAEQSPWATLTVVVARASCPPRPR